MPNSTLPWWNSCWNEFMDSRLLDILVCPICKGPLVHRRAQAEFICKADRLAFPIRGDIPVMLAEAARRLPPEEEVNESAGRRRLRSFTRPSPPLCRRDLRPVGSLARRSPRLGAWP